MSSPKKQKTGESHSEEDCDEIQLENSDVLREGTESELTKLPNIIYCLSMVEPSYRNGGNQSSFQLFHTEYEALVAKWGWVTGWTDGQDDDDNVQAPKCEFSSSTHEGTYGGDYIFCEIQKADMNNLSKADGSFFYNRLNC